MVEKTIHCALLSAASFQTLILLFFRAVKIHVLCMWCSTKAMPPTTKPSQGIVTCTVVCTSPLYPAGRGHCRRLTLVAVAAKLCSPGWAFQGHPPMGSRGQSDVLLSQGSPRDLKHPLCLYNHHNPIFPRHRNSTYSQAWRSTFPQWPSHKEWEGIVTSTTGQWGVSHSWCHKQWTLLLKLLCPST